MFSSIPTRKYSSRTSNKGRIIQSRMVEPMRNIELNLVPGYVKFLKNNPQYLSGIYNNYTLLSFFKASPIQNYPLTPFQGTITTNNQTNTEFINRYTVPPKSTIVLFAIYPRNQLVNQLVYSTYSNINSVDEFVFTLRFLKVDFAQRPTLKAYIASYGGSDSYTILSNPNDPSTFITQFTSSNDGDQYANLITLPFTSFDIKVV